MMKTFLVVFTLSLAACSSTPPPPPPQALGPIVKVNPDEEALAELIRAARAGLPKQTRYSAERGDDVKSVLAAWTKTARLKLVWRFFWAIKATRCWLSTQTKTPLSSLIFQKGNAHGTPPQNPLPRVGHVGLGHHLSSGRAQSGRVS